jgi:thioredoxin-dependent peroxiredoxin
MTGIVEGAGAPAIDLPTDGGGRFRLTDGSGQSTVVFFYPKADTPGCTNEAKDFSALIDDFAAAGARVIGVSRDPLRALDRFKARHDLKIVLGSDEAGAVTEAFGVWGEKSMYGRTYMGIERSTFLIGPDGVVRRVWRSVKVKGHAAEVLAAVEGN